MYSRLPSRFFLRRGDVCTQLKLCRIRILNFLSYSFGIETTNTLIYNRSSLVNHTRFQRKMGKIFSRFQTKTAQKPYPLGGHIPEWLIQGSTPPPGQWGWFCSLLASPRKLNGNFSETLEQSRITVIYFHGSRGHFSGRRIKVSINLKITH